MNIPCSEERDRHRTGPDELSVAIILDRDRAGAAAVVSHVKGAGRVDGLACPAHWARGGVDGHGRCSDATLVVSAADRRLRRLSGLSTVPQTALSRPAAPKTPGATVPDDHSTRAGCGTTRMGEMARTSPRCQPAALTRASPAGRSATAASPMATGGG